MIKKILGFIRDNIHKIQNRNQLHEIAFAIINESDQLLTLLAATESNDAVPAEVAKEIDEPPVPTEPVFTAPDPAQVVETPTPRPHLHIGPTRCVIQKEDGKPEIGGAVSQSHHGIIETLHGEGSNGVEVNHFFSVYGPWYKKFLENPKYMPEDSAIRKMFSRINTKVFRKYKLDFKIKLRFDHTIGKLRAYLVRIGDVLPWKKVKKSGL